MFLQINFLEGEAYFYEKPLRGFDVEGGVFIPCVFPSYYSLMLHAGGYHYSGSDVVSRSGVKGRLELQIDEPFMQFGFHGTRFGY